MVGRAPAVPWAAAKPRRRGAARADSVSIALKEIHGLMLVFGAFVSLAVAAAARHRHDAVPMIAWVASIILTWVGVGFFPAPASHMLDPGPYFRIALGVAGGGFAVAAVALAYAKAKNMPDDRRGQFGYGGCVDVAIDPDTKLIVSWLVSDRTAGAAHDFMADLASRLVSRPQITTDASTSYLTAIEAAFGSEVDYGQLIKDYGVQESEDASPTARRYSPNVVKAVEKRVVAGNPDPDHISTSHVERSNLSMRMGMRRFTRLTNGFSKKVENHAAAVALHFMYTNLGRTMKVLANPYPRTPAMAAGIADHIWTCENIAALLD